MRENIRLVEIELIDVDNDSTGKRTIARFLNELTPQDYGIQRFITQAGEISVMNLLDDGFKLGYLDIRRILNEILTQRKRKNNFKGSWIGTNDAIRYFADLSPQGNIWYWEYMRIGYNYELDKQVIVSINTEITYDNWFLLSESSKIEYMSYFLDNPVNGNDPYYEYIYDKMK